jgi:hypothetical protein
MSEFTNYQTQLSTPFTEKTSRQLVGKIEQQSETQTTTATAAGTFLWIATFAGQIGDLYIAMSEGMAAGESVVFDVQKNGSTVLTGTLTVNLASGDGLQALLPSVDKALMSFVVGDLFTVDRTYTAGGGPNAPITTLLMEPSTGQYVE